MRVVGGRFRGRTLATPADQSIRPTSDRVREAMFNMLAHGAAHIECAQATVLDLFAGTGALGLEALSRGAAFCLFVDDSADARGLIRDNVEAFGLTGITKIYRRDATALGPVGRYQPFNLVLLDPPYGQGLAERALLSAAAGGWIAAGATIVLEERAVTQISLPPHFHELDRRAWGDTQVVFARYQSEPGSVS
jgi:16S rRNA (guanine966-N2)-methyltransferase